MKCFYKIIPSYECSMIHRNRDIKKLKPNAIIKGIILNNINKIIEGAIKTYALLDGLFQYFLIFSIYYFNLSIERATFY